MRIERREMAGCSREAAIAAVGRLRDAVVLQIPEFDPLRLCYLPPRVVLAFDPVEVCQFELGGDDPFEAMRAKLRPSRLQGRGDIPWPLGWMGYWGYECNCWIEAMPCRAVGDIDLPVARFALYDTAAVWDEAAGRWSIVAADLGNSCRPGTRERMAKWERLLGSADEFDQDGNGIGPACVDAVPAADRKVPPIQHNMSREQYLRMVQRAREYIAAGDIFQVNLARRESFQVAAPAVDTFLKLRQTNAGQYAAMLRWGDADSRVGENAILCSSPEMFLQLRGRDVITRPIKGTRPRSNDWAEDARLQRELAGSDKDRAELAMIVDLERNDLGRVCEFGSVRVLSEYPAVCDGACGQEMKSDTNDAQPYALESLPTVHHLVSTVAGRLRPECDAIDLLRACFPGGSITGAPKVRAMQIIDELEPSPRSVYTGGIGHLGLDGSMTLNIAIRTMIQNQGRLHLYTGGGIVADSDPQAEYAETQAKALGMRQALEM